MSIKKSFLNNTKILICLKKIKINYWIKLSIFNNKVFTGKNYPKKKIEKILT